MMKYAAIILTLLGLLLFIPVNVDVDIRLRTKGAYVRVVPKLLFGAIRPRFEANAEYRFPEGIVFAYGKKRKLLGKKKGVGKKPRFLKAFRIKNASVFGRAGINGEPAASVMLTGALRILLIQSLLVPFRDRPKVCFLPELNGSCFTLDLKGIIRAVPGKVLLMGIKPGRRNKNESSN